VTEDRGRARCAFGDQDPERGGGTWFQKVFGERYNELRRGGKLNEDSIEALRDPEGGRKREKRVAQRKRRTNREAWPDR